MSRYTVALTDTLVPVWDIEERELAKVDAQLVVHQCRSVEDVINAVPRDVDAIMNVFAPIPSVVIDALEKCKIIARYGVGVDTIDLEAAARKGIVVANVPDYCVDETSALTMGLLLSCAIKIPFLDRSVRKGIWDRWSAKPVYRLRGKVLGLIGFGRMARAVAYRAKAFGLQCIAFDPYVERHVIEGHGLTAVDWTTVLQTSDFICVHVPLSSATKHIIGEPEFKMMKRSAYLINASRGAIVDEEALYRALVDGEIAGAGLDVLEHEPPDESNPLLALDNVTITPHSGAFSEEALLELRTRATFEVIRVLTGERAMNPVAPSTHST